MRSCGGGAEVSRDGNSAIHPHPTRSTPCSTQPRRTTTTTATDAGRKVHRRPSAALIVSSLALFTALSGGAYAATTIGSLQIKNNAVQSIDIKDGTIKTADMSARRAAGPEGQGRTRRPGRLPGAPGAYRAHRPAPRATRATRASRA